MGILDQVLAYTDNKRRVVARNVSDLINEPRAALQTMAYRGAETAKEQIDAAASGDVSSLLPGGSSTAGLLGTFAGVGSKTFPHAKAILYQRAIDRGMPAEKATQITGIWRGPEGKLRYEIPDTGMKLRPTDLDFTGTPSKIKEYSVEHKELLEAYPQLEKLLADTLPRVNPTLRDPKGAYVNSKTRGEYIEAEAPGFHSLKKTTAHELQHAIQQIEDFAKGGSPQMFAPESKQILKTMGKYLEPDQAVKADKLTPFQAYRKLAGEAESRAVEKRLEDAIFNKSTPTGNPLDAYDIPFDQMIIRK